MPYRHVNVRGYDRDVYGRKEHVKAHKRRVYYRPGEEPTPVEPYEVTESIHVDAHESTSRSGGPEKVGSYDYARREERFSGGSKELYNKVYREYRAKGYSKSRAREIAGGTVGKVYREKMKEAGD
jgi:hypothetical protein